MSNGALNGTSDLEKIGYSTKIYTLRNKGNELSNNIKELKTNIQLLLKSYERAETTDSDLLSMILSLRDKTLDLEIKLGGSKKKRNWRRI